MLILTRRVGESLIIGDDIVVEILGVKGNQVRVGVDAPKSVSVHREEIYNRIQDEIEKVMDENPDLSRDQVIGILQGIEEAKAGKVSEYEFD